MVSTKDMLRSCRCRQLPARNFLPNICWNQSLEQDFDKSQGDLCRRRFIGSAFFIAPCVDSVDLTLMQHHLQEGPVSHTEPQVNRSQVAELVSYSCLPMQRPQKKGRRLCFMILICFVKNSKGPSTLLATARPAPQPRRHVK